MGHVLRYVPPLLRRIPVLALTLILAVLCACGSSHVGESEGTPELQKASDCPAQDCIPAAEASAQLGFTILEPSYVPPNFALYDRTLLRDMPPVTVSIVPNAQSGDGTGRAHSVVLQYRFKGSPNVPFLTVTEEGAHAGGPELSTGAVIQLTRPDCAETITVGKSTIYYVHGLAALTTDGAGTYDLCKSEDRDMHYAAMILDKVVVEIMGFTESGISKDDVIKIASSLHPVR